MYVMFSFTIVHYFKRNAGMVLLQIFKANLQVQLAGASNNVLTRLLNDALNHGIRLWQTLQPFNKLGEIGRVFGLNSDSHHRADAELHHLHVVRILKGGDCSCFNKILIYSNKTHNVTARHIFNGLNVTAHHQNGPGKMKLNHMVNYQNIFIFYTWQN